MADFGQNDAPLPDWMTALPAFSLEAPAPTGIFGPALASGFHETLGGLGSTAQAVGALTGWQGAQDWGKGFAQRQAAAATEAGNPELEKEGFGSIRGALYGLTKGLPGMAAAIAPFAIPGVGPVAKLVGSGAVMGAQAVGGNVEAAEGANAGQLTSGDAAKSLLLGGVEGAAFTAVPHKLAGILEKGAAGNFFPRVAGGALKIGALQGVLGAAQTAVTQEAFTPDMPVAQRAQQVVDSALSGGIQGAVFGGLTSLRRAQAPAKTAPPAEVTNANLATATDAVVQPPAQIPPPEHMTPLPKAAGVDFSDTSNEDLMGMATPLAAKTRQPGSGEDITHALLQGEIARRTEPGLDPGQGTLRTPEQMAALQPRIDATRNIAIEAAGGKVPQTTVVGSSGSALGETPEPVVPKGSEAFFQGFNASSEPELVNSLMKSAETFGDKAPGWFKTLAGKYGVSGETPAERLRNLSDQEQKSQEARKAAENAVPRNSAVMRSINAAITAIIPKVAEAERLVQMHVEAGRLRAQQAPPDDSVAGMNIPGMGERPPFDPGTAGDAGDLTPDVWNQMKGFQDLALSAFEGRVRAKVEPIIRSTGATSEPQLIDALRDQHAVLDGATPPPALGALLEYYGISDREGVPLDLDAARMQMRSQYADQLNKAEATQKAGAAGQADILYGRAHEFNDTVIKAQDDLMQSHGLADDMKSTDVDPSIEVPSTVPPELADRYRFAKTLENGAGKPVTIKAAKLAETAIESGDPNNQPVMNLARIAYLDEMRARSRRFIPADEAWGAGAERRAAEAAEAAEAAKAAEAVGVPPVDETGQVAPAPVLEPPAPPAPSLDDRIIAASTGDTLSINKLHEQLSDVPRKDVDAAVVRLEQAGRIQGMAHDLPSMAKAAGTLKRPNGEVMHAILAREPISSEAVKSVPNSVEGAKDVAAPVQGIVPGTSDALNAMRKTLIGEPKRTILPDLRAPSDLDTQTAKTPQSNVGPASTVQASRSGGDAYRADTSRADNPFDKATQSDEWGAWRKGWETASRSTHVGATPEPKKGVLPKTVDSVRAEEKLTAAVQGGKLSAGKLAQAEKVLAMPRGDAKNIMMRDLERSWSMLEQGGRPFDQSISGMEPPKLATVDDPSKDWAKSAADAAYGDVVQANDRVALIKGADSLGRPVYLGVDRNSGLRDTSDIRSSKSSVLQGIDKANAVEAARQAALADNKAFDKNQEGPFKDATDRVIGSAGANPKIVGYIGRLLRTVGIDARVLVTTPDDVRGMGGDALGLHGPYSAARGIGRQQVLGEMTSFGPGMKDFLIHVDPDLPEDLQVETAAHEVGHIIYKTALRNASPEVSAQIDRAYKTFLRQTEGKSAQDIIRATRNRATSRELLDNRAPNSEPTQEFHDYFRTKSEWFADQVSRWATTADKPRGAIEQFFHGVAQQIKQLISAITGGKFFPDYMVGRFLDRLADASDLQMLGDPVRGERIPMTSETGPRTPQEADTAVHQTVASVSDIKDWITERAWAEPKAGLGTAMRRALLPAETLEGIVRIGKKFLPQAQGWMDFYTDRQRFGDAKDKAHVISARTFMAAKPEVRAKVNELMAMMNDGSGLDPRKALAAHTDLVVTPEITARHAEMVSRLDALRTAGGRPALEAILQMNQTLGYQDLTAKMYRAGVSWMKQGYPPFEGFDGINPDAKYREMTGMAGHDSPDATNLTYKNWSRQMRDGVAKYVEDADLAASLKVPGARAGGLDDMRANLKGWNASMTMFDKGTYVPITRGEGKYFVSGKLAIGDDKAPLPAAVRALQAAIEKDFPNIGIFHDSDSNTVMSRVESMAQAERLKTIFQGLETAGHMLPGETKTGYPDRIDTMAGLGPKYMQQMLEAANEMIANTDIKDDNVANQLKQQMVDKWMDMLPDNSVLRNMQPRKNISGFAKDMGENAIRIAVNKVRASTSLGMQPAWAEASAAIRDGVQQAKSGSLADSVKTQDIANELWLREAQQAWKMPHSVFDTMQMGMHMLRIGFSPPYVLTMMSQVGTLSLPELSKKWGYARSSLALAKAAPHAFTALRAMLSDPDRAKAGMREMTLRKGGLSEKYIQTALKLDNMGGGSSSAYTSALTGLGEGASAGLHKFKDMSNAMGLYAEMFPRLITAFAAGDLYDARPVKGVSREQVVYDMVNGSQFNWGAGQSSRLTGKGGPLGSASKVVFQFTSFQTRMIEKLYTEAKGLFDNDPALRAESAKFLGGHLISMVAIAGTLGLPAMGAIAGIADKLISAWTGKDDIDTQGMYRTWLSGMFGPGVADVLAKGLPRGLGIDESHLGEQNILPFTGVLQNKRKLEDAVRDFTKGLAGSAVGELSNMYLGARDMVNGDYLRGAIKVLPEGFKGLAEGYSFYKNGYVDKNGTKYPIQPGAMDILMASLGLDPANLAQYDEALHIWSGLMAQRQYRSQNIETHLLRGINNPDNADMHHWINEAMQYDLDHPGVGHILQRLQTTVMNATKKSASAQALHTVIGVSPMDRSMLNNLGFITPQQQ